LLAPFLFWQILLLCCHAIRPASLRPARLRLLHRSKPVREFILSRSWTMKFPFFSVCGEKLRIAQADINSPIG